MSSQKYLPHIDGLRALAVIAVVIYHLDSNWLPGGFLGVDIFFVISGYLITNIIYRDKLQNNFSYIDFYVRRIKRIIPALYFLLILVFAASYVIYMPYDFYKVGISAFSTIVFLANYQFAFRKGDYFSGSAEEWPLLHTWSLSVEEQYYFLLPIILTLLLKLKTNKIYFTLISLILISALSSYLLAAEMTSLNYYSLITRVQELMVGSLVAIYAFRRNAIISSSYIPAVSVVLILCFLIFFNSSYVFPSPIATLFSILVAVIFLSRDTIVNKVFENNLLIWIGKLSYSLYLIHWPVMAIFRYVLNTQDEVDYVFSLEEKAYILLIISLLSFVSYYLVETPLRKMTLSRKKVIGLYFLVPSALLIAFAAYVIKSNGVPERLDENNLLASKLYYHINKEQCPNLINNGCQSVYNSENKKKRILLYGNSHAEHYFSVMTAITEHSDTNLFLYASGGCGPDSVDNKCSVFRSSFFDNLEDTDIVYISYRFDHVYEKDLVKEKLVDEIRRIKAITDKVVLLAQPPILNSSPLKIYNCKRLDLQCSNNLNFVGLQSIYNDVFDQLAKSSGIVFFNPYSDKISSKLLSSNKAFSDSDHLSVYGGEMIADYIINENLQVPYLD